jgi:hypothetical protein
MFEVLLVEEGKSKHGRILIGLDLLVWAEAGCQFPRRASGFSNYGLSSASSGVSSPELDLRVDLRL